MKGEKRVAYAMLDSDVRERRGSAWRFGTVKVSSAGEKNLGRRGARGGIVFFDLAVSVREIRGSKGFSQRRPAC
jgi:hypothetical protein